MKGKEEERRVEMRDVSITESNIKYFVSQVN